MHKLASRARVAIRRASPVYKTQPCNIALRTISSPSADLDLELHVCEYFVQVLLFATLPPMSMRAHVTTLLPVLGQSLPAPNKSIRLDVQYSQLGSAEQELRTHGGLD